jgi:hypothetical protein
MMRVVVQHDVQIDIWWRIVLYVVVPAKVHQICNDSRSLHTFHDILLRAFDRTCSDRPSEHMDGVSAQTRRGTFSRGMA